VLFVVCWLGAVSRWAYAAHPALDTPFLLFTGGAIAVYLAAFVDLALWFWRLRRGARCPLKERRLRAGMAAWAASDARIACEEFRQALKLDPADVEANLLFATVLARTGQVKQARRRLRICARYDLRHKWAWEISREMTRLSRPSRHTKEAE